MRPIANAPTPACVPPQRSTGLHRLRAWAGLAGALVVAGAAGAAPVVSGGGLCVTANTNISANSSGYCAEISGNVVSRVDQANSPSGGAQAITTYELVQGQTVLRHEIDLYRAGVPYELASFNLIDQKFSVDVDTPFWVSGAMLVSDAGAPARVSFKVNLFDRTSTSFVFYNDQYSQNSANEILTLGERGGDASNSLRGALTGMLLAGHSYEWDVHALIATDGLFASAASATAEVTLTLGTLVPDLPAPQPEPPGTPFDVPEPATAALVVVAALAARAGRRQKPSRAI